MNFGKNSKVASFDVFDTCLVRKCGTPDCFFDVLSFWLFSDTVSETVRQAFVSERRLAEQKAYAVYGDRTTLDNIYDSLDFNCQYLSKNQIKEKELECESSMLLPVVFIREQIEKLRNNGYHIVFISDMYLPSSFIRSILMTYDIYKDGDTIYVSCETGFTKTRGLFRFVKERERLKYCRWKHYGDNPDADIIIPRRLGIKTKRVNHSYTSLQSYWLEKRYVNEYQYPGILAGISRAFRFSNEANSQADFILDIIAPIYCSYLCNVLKSAEEKGITKLFFCARDTFHLYSMAKRIQLEHSLYSNIEIQYLYVSRESLYGGDDVIKLAYFKKIGLASTTERIGLVDTTTTGKTLSYLNGLLSHNGYNNLYAFYLFKWDYQNEKIEIDLDKVSYSIRQAYTSANKSYEPLYRHLTAIVENFFCLTCHPKTIGYTIESGSPVPVFNDDIGYHDIIQTNRERWFKVREGLLKGYLDSYIQTGLYLYSKEVFQHLALPALLMFCSRPDKTYLKALLSLQFSEDSAPYVRKESVFRLACTLGRDSGWRKGTLYYNLPLWVTPILEKLSRNYKKNYSF